MKSKSTSPEFSVRDFFKRFPDDDACLNHVMSVRYGKEGACPHCGTITTFHRIAKRKAYAGAACGCHVYPCAGTIFEDSRTSLQIWFYAIYLFVATRHGVSGKELQRQLGVTYKTAWRMGQQIRDLMAKADGFQMLAGHIEADEAYVGGRRPGKRGRGAEGKTIVSTDELMSYGLLTGDGYLHGQVKHGAKEFAHYDYRHDVTHHVNHVESFWKLFKHSVRSTHIHISAKHMDRYLREFTFRSNHRERENLMFDLLIGAV